MKTSPAPLQRLAPLSGEALVANITTRKIGSRFISFVNAAGEPRHITLGKVPKRYAEALKVKVEDLASAALHGHAPTDDTTRWLASIDDRLYEKLAAVGLAPQRSGATIGAWLEWHLNERESMSSWRRSSSRAGIGAHLRLHLCIRHTCASLTHFVEPPSCGNLVERCFYRFV